MYSPAKVSLKGTGILTPTLSKTSNAVSSNSVAAFLTQAAVINRDYSYKGHYFKLHFPTELNFYINRRAFLAKNQTRFVAAMNQDLRTWLHGQVAEMQLIAASVIDRIVYDTEAEVIRVTKRKGKESTVRAYRADYERSGNLKRAVIEGVKLTGYEISIGIDEKLAPYWIWVERGHRVVLPGGVETGTFVKGRPFIDLIFTELNDYIETKMVPLMQTYLEHISYVTSEWVVGRTASVRTIKYPVS